MGDENPTVKSNSPIPAHQQFLIPSPIPTRRTRTFSQSERAKEGPSEKGMIQNFCREKGHGFIIPEGGDVKDHLFVHISDIDGEYVPKPGDIVKYKKCLIPPKLEKYQAVHVTIIHPAAGTTHERWDQPSPTSSPRS